MENLVFDRTQNDVEMDTPKSYYRYKDLKRVETWCEYLANLLTSYSYPVSVIVKKNWTVSDKSNDNDMERIRGNIDAIKTVFHAYTDIPENLNYMTIEKANAIEKILYEIYSLIRNMGNEFRYSNTFCSGESEGLN